MAVYFLPGHTHTHTNTHTRTFRKIFAPHLQDPSPNTLISLTTTHTSITHIALLPVFDTNECLPDDTDTHQRTIYPGSLLPVAKPPSVKSGRSTHATVVAWKVFVATSEFTTSPTSAHRIKSLYSARIQANSLRPPSETYSP